MLYLESTGIAQGQLVRSTGRIVSVPVGNGMIGRVVNAVGQPVDGKDPATGITADTPTMPFGGANVGFRPP